MIRYALAAILGLGIATAAYLPHASASTPAETARSGSVDAKKKASVQCSATTKKGERCKRMTTNDNGKCYQHQ